MSELQTVPLAVVTSSGLCYVFIATVKCYFTQHKRVQSRSVLDSLVAILFPAAYLMRCMHTHTHHMYRYATLPLPGCRTLCHQAASASSPPVSLH